MDGYQPGPSGSGEIVLDLSTRKKPEDTNNNIKTEQGIQEGERKGDEGSLRSRKYSELSECSAASEAPSLGAAEEGPEGAGGDPCQEEVVVNTNKRVNTSPDTGPEPKKLATAKTES